MKLSELKVHVLQDDGNWKWVPIEESPYYIALNKGPIYFYKYHSLLLRYLARTRTVFEISYEEFINLKDNIETNGFIIQHPRITIQNKNEVLDGQHRLSIILYVAGDLNLEIENNEVIEIGKY